MKLKEINNNYFPYKKVFKNNASVIEEIFIKDFLKKKNLDKKNYDYIVGFELENIKDLSVWQDTRWYTAIKNIKNNRLRHFFHIVTASPWPLTVSLLTIGFFLPFAWYLHHHTGMSREDIFGYFDARFIGYVSLISFCMICYTSYCWFKDIIKESLNMHTLMIQKCLKLAFLLFIASEIMFFFAFFWGFFHSALSPVIWIGCLWPPVEYDTISPWRIPALNTWILVFSGFTVTYVHKAIVERVKKDTYIGFALTLILALTFTRLQYWEYKKASFALNDGVYGSCFYMLTGFHGFHVLLGTIMLLICLIRYHFKDFSPRHHIGLVTAIWYWHFVDVVWIFLFLAVYWWGNYPLFDNKIITKLILWEKFLQPFGISLVETNLFKDKNNAWLEIMMHYCFENANYFKK